MREDRRAAVLLTLFVSLHRYSAFVPIKVPAYHPADDETLPLARRLNAGFKLPNTYKYESLLLCPCPGIVP